MSLSRVVSGIASSTQPMEARLAGNLPIGPNWQYEPKWDGFRCLAFRSGDTIELRAKSGKPLARYFPEIVQAVGRLHATHFVVDGEIIIDINGRPSFDALQMRLHPAVSRINRLAKETPAHIVLFDMLQVPNGKTVLHLPLTERRSQLEQFVHRIGPSNVFGLSPSTVDFSLAQHWLRHAVIGTDGVVAKRMDEPYRPGERAMVKVKRIRTADCVVGGFRYGSGTKLVGSLLLGLYDHAGLLHHVGFTSSIARADRAALTKKLEARRKSPGFTGRAPGAPSRWSGERSTAWQPVRPDLVAEVQYNHVTNRHFRHGTKLIRWRPDKAPEQCSFDQLGALGRAGTKRGNNLDPPALF
jgi:ATP-dependent DNA ligase